MNLGRGEGSDSIQLFGRGVRLKGWNMTLNRSDFHEQNQCGAIRICRDNKPNCSCRHSQLRDGGAGDSSEHSPKNKKTVAKGLGINSPHLQRRASGHP